MHTRKLSQAKNYSRTLITIKYKQFLPPTRCQKCNYTSQLNVEIYRVTNSDNRKKNHTHTRLYTHMHARAHNTHSNYGNVNCTQHTHQHEYMYTVASTISVSCLDREMGFQRRSERLNLSVYSCIYRITLRVFGWCMLQHRHQQQLVLFVSRLTALIPQQRQRPCLQGR